MKQELWTPSHRRLTAPVPLNFECEEMPFYACLKRQGETDQAHIERVENNVDRWLGSCAIKTRQFLTPHDVADTVLWYTSEVSRCDDEIDGLAKYSETLKEDIDGQRLAQWTKLQQLNVTSVVDSVLPSQYSRGNYLLRDCYEKLLEDKDDMRGLMTATLGIEKMVRLHSDSLNISSIEIARLSSPVSAVVSDNRSIEEDALIKERFSNFEHELSMSGIEYDRDPFMADKKLFFHGTIHVPTPRYTYEHGEMTTQVTVGNDVINDPNITMRVEGSFLKATNKVYLEGGNIVAVVERVYYIPVDENKPYVRGIASFDDYARTRAYKERVREIINHDETYPCSVNVYTYKPYDYAIRQSQPD